MGYILEVSQIHKCISGGELYDRAHEYTSTAEVQQRKDLTFCGIRKILEEDGS